MSAPRSIAARRVERPILPNPFMPTRVLMSDLLGLHLDCSAGAFLDTDAAALAEVVVELVRVRRTGSELRRAQGSRHRGCSAPRTWKLRMLYAGESGGSESWRYVGSD